MIVKNEEEVLERCLNSLKGLMDEIIIVDTGSTDSTKEIAARYTDKIYDFSWCDDFAAARNFSFSKASMDFAMWLDADDVFLEADKNAFIELKNSIPDNVDVVMLRYHTAFDEEGKPVFSYYRERLIRKGTVSFWKGRVHEVIVHTGRVMYSEVAVTHRSVKTGYNDRNLRIYEKQEKRGKAQSFSSFLCATRPKNWRRKALKKTNCTNFCISSCQMAANALFYSHSLTL